MASIPFEQFDVLTFDCYGTLIDWEAGLLAGVRAILDPRGVEAADEDLLARYAAQESALESGPYLRYREVLARRRRRGLPRAGRDGVARGARRIRRQRGRLAGVPRLRGGAGSGSSRASRSPSSRTATTTCSRPRTGAWASSSTSSITAQQCGSYKPSPHNFEVAFERIDRPRNRILHVAQSLFHDHVPAKAIGHDDGLDQSPPRPSRQRRDAAGRRDAGPRDARHGHLRGPRDRLTIPPLRR